jgi:RNase adapter protein RapZ
MNTFTTALAMRLVVVTGMSGSGKTVALHALEDSGFYCVDNLPPELLPDLVALQHQRGVTRLAVAVDVRSAQGLPDVPARLAEARRNGIDVQPVFLDAHTDTLVRRYSETRRRHPLSPADAGQGDHRRALTEAIDMERHLLADLREHAHVIDTGLIQPAQLQQLLKSLVQGGQPGVAGLTLVFESFAFKRGIPLDADYVFDVRMLPNPHYDPALRSLTGRDEAVAKFLAAQTPVQRMLHDITTFVRHWLPELAANHRSYVTVAIGCTGGQHRSVYLAEQLTQAFTQDWHAICRHRELDRQSLGSAAP